MLTQFSKHILPLTPDTKMETFFKQRIVGIKYCKTYINIYVYNKKPECLSNYTRTCKLSKFFVV